MDLKKFLNEIREKNLNKLYVYYKDDEGKVRNICYQNDVFFAINNEDESLEILNPLRKMDVLSKIKKHELELIGTGQYHKDIDLSNIKKHKGENRSWELLL